MDRCVGSLLQVTSSPGRLLWARHRRGQRLSAHQSAGTGDLRSCCPFCSLMSLNGCVGTSSSWVPPRAAAGPLPAVLSPQEVRLCGTRLTDLRPFAVARSTVTCSCLSLAFMKADSSRCTLGPETSLLRVVAILPSPCRSPLTPSRPKVDLFEIIPEPDAQISLCGFFLEMAGVGVGVGRGETNIKCEFPSCDSPIHKVESRADFLARRLCFSR